MNNSIKDLDITDLLKISDPDTTTNIGNKFFLSYTKGEQLKMIANRPFRFNGHLQVMCTKGNMCVDLNMQKREVKPNSIAMNMPGNIWCLHDDGEHSLNDVECVIIAASTAFVSEIKFEVTSILDSGEKMIENPYVDLNTPQAECALQFAKLMYMICKSGAARAENTIQYMLSAGMNMVKEVWVEQAEKSDATSKVSSRAKQLFDSFLVLVKRHYRTERGVGFYAERLGLTPKYLSRVVREVSGQAAPEWIDSFVIMDAKNLLKFSDKPIKEISAGLNFTSPSAFHAFFKARAGVTPMQYREA